MSTRRKASRSKGSRGNVGSNALWWMLTDRGRARETKIAGLFVFGQNARVTTRVFLIRHGATELSAEDRFAGAVDVLLSDAGRDQARRLGARLAGEKIRVAFASPMKRTMETARLVVEPCGIAVSPVDGIREIAHGRWE